MGTEEEKIWELIDWFDIQISNFKFSELKIRDYFDIFTEMYSYFSLASTQLTLIYEHWINHLKFLNDHSEFLKVTHEKFEE